MSDTLTGHQADSVPATTATGQIASLTYEPYYGLKEKPFSLAADPRFFYKSPSHTSAFNDLLAAIRRREGLVVLTGEIGTGKTTLCRTVLEHLDQQTFTTFVPDPTVSRKDLLKILLVDFGVVSVDDLKDGRLKGASRPDLSYPLYEFLISLVPLQAFAVLIIDEAQNLSVPVLEEIRILLDLEGRDKLLQVVLVGQPDLRSELKLPRMRQVDQRVSMRCALEPLSRDSMAGYVSHRLNVAGGGNARVEFSAGALDVVYQGSGGVPRLINLVCDRALQRGYLGRTARIEPEIVWSAIADLGLSVSPTPEAPEPVTGTPPRGLFEKTTAPTEEFSSEMDLKPLLAIRPVTQPQLDQTAVQDEHPTPTASDPGGAELAGSPARHPRRGPNAAAALGAPRWGALAEASGIPTSRPATSRLAEAFGGGGRRSKGSPIPKPGRARRLWLPAAALLLAALSGAIGAGLGVLADRTWVVYLPPPPVPPSLLQTRRLEALPPPDEAQVTDLLGAELAGVGEGSSVPGTEAAEPYVIQVASVDSPQLANQVVQDLSDAGYRVYQVELTLGPRVRLHQVLVGPYGTFAEAESDLARVHEIPDYADAKVVGPPPDTP